MRSQYLGQEVAAGAITPLVEVMLAAKIDAALLPTLAELSQPKVRLSWDQFLHILRIARAHFSDEELLAIGASSLHSRYYAPRMRFARRLLTLDDAYRLMVYPHGKIDYGCIQAAVDAKPGHVKITAILFEQYPPSETFFLMLQGATKELPALFGEPDTQVDCDISGRYMHFEIRYTPPKTRAQQLKSRFSSRFRQGYCMWNRSNADDELIRRTFALETALRERDAARQTLNLNAAEQQRRMAHLSEVVVEYDHLNQVAYLSPNGEKVFGYPNSVLLDSPLKILVPEDIPAAEAFFANPKSLPSGVYPMRGRHADGRSLTLEVAVNHFENAKGEEGWMATFRDVTDRTLDVYETTELSRGLHQLDRIQEPQLATNASLPRVLVADDDHLTRRIAQKILNQAGYDVICVNDGTKVIEILEQQPIAGLVLDVNMPGLTGLEVYEKLQSNFENVPVIFVSGEPHRVRNDYPDLPIVTKPFRSAQLIDAVRGAIAA